MVCDEQNRLLVDFYSKGIRLSNSIFAVFVLDIVATVTPWLRQSLWYQELNSLWAARRSKTWVGTGVTTQCVCFYYCSDYYKAVDVGGGGEWRTCATRDDEPNAGAVAVRHLRGRMDG